MAIVTIYVSDKLLMSRKRRRRRDEGNNMHDLLAFRPFDEECPTMPYGFAQIIREGAESRNGILEVRKR